MKDILDLTRDELDKWLEEKGKRAFRSAQIFKWLYIRQADHFTEMTDLSKAFRKQMSSYFYISRLVLEDKQISADGTEKFLFMLGDGQYIESVLIPEKDHFTLCVSSQVGCAQACQFCFTARGGLKRNLTVSEITAQVRDARKYLTERKIDPLKLSNIVFMGMGEPLANYKNVVKALCIITDTDYGLKFSPRKVTVSTSGLAPEIVQLGMDTDVNLAVSLNAATDDIRSTLMPVNRRYRLAELLKACQAFTMKPRNKITFEYILMRGVNDTREDALRLVKLLAPIKAKVNLIPFNEYKNSIFKKPSKNDVSNFLQVLLDKKMTAITRKRKGGDISAACGQLSAKLIK